MNTEIKFTNLVSVVTYFSDDNRSKEYLEKLRWSDGCIRCPKCNGDKVWISKKKKFNYICGNKECKQNIFSVTKGTIFENSNIPLYKWFAAMWLITSHKKGVSSPQLSRDLQITQKSAWFLLHRVRYAIRTKSFTSVMENTVESDETFVGGKAKNRGGRPSLREKAIVFGVLERDGKVKTFKVPDTKSSTLKPIIMENVKQGSKLMTDEWVSYKGLDKFYNHQSVNHGAKEYVRGEVHTNTIEGYWSLLKRGFLGVYHQVSHKHIEKYLSEFEYRYNNRKMTQEGVFLDLLSYSETRLRYKTLIL